MDAKNQIQDLDTRILPNKKKKSKINYTYNVTRIMLAKIACSSLRSSRNMLQRSSVRTFETTSTTKYGEKYPGAKNGIPYSELPANKKRPLSPHVSLYIENNTFPTVAISSVTNRATGALLCVGMWGIGALSVLPGVDPASIMMTLGNSAVGPVLKFGVAFPLVYHYVAGIRHVIWDKYVYGFNNDAMHQSSLLVAGSSLAISGVAAIL